MDPLGHYKNARDESTKIVEKDTSGTVQRSGKTMVNSFSWTVQASFTCAAWSDHVAAI
jgi:hypothetical protein